MGRVKLRFAGLEVEFVDRVRGIQQVIDWVEGVVIQPIVVFGPEGCGKSAWLKQVAEVLKEGGFDVIYVDVLHREFIAYTDVREVLERLSEVIADVTGYSYAKLADLVVLIVKELLKKWRKRKVALLVDEVFQAIGLDKAEIYTKVLLNLIEYPPTSYEKIIAVITTSEGLSRWRIGRHRWAWLMPMWNMSKEGFKELYDKLPEPKPDFEDVWRLCGGNPFILEQLYQVRWDVNKVITNLIKGRGLTPNLISKWGELIKSAIDDPDVLWSPEVPKELINELIEKNLIVYDLYPRDKYFWIDEPPPEKDSELGIGKYVAWQTPLHREAVRRVLEESKVIK